MGRCGRQNMLRQYLKNWDCDLIFGRAVKVISSPGVRSSWHTSTYMRVVSYYNLCSIPNFVMIFFCQHLDSISLHAYFILVTGILRVLRGVIGKCFMYAAKIIANWSTCGRKPGDYNSKYFWDWRHEKLIPTQFKINIFCHVKTKIALLFCWTHCNLSSASE